MIQEPGHDGILDRCIVRMNGVSRFYAQILVRECRNDPYDPRCVKSVVTDGRPIILTAWKEANGLNKLGKGT